MAPFISQEQLNDSESIIESLALTKQDDKSLSEIIVRFLELNDFKKDTGGVWRGKRSGGIDIIFTEIYQIDRSIKIMMVEALVLSAVKRDKLILAE